MDSKQNQLNDYQVKRLLDSIFINQIERIDLKAIMVSVGDHKLSDFQKRFIRFVAQKGGELGRYLPSGDSFAFDKKVEPRQFRLDRETAFMLAQQVRLLQNLLGLLLGEDNLSEIKIDYPC